MAPELSESELSEVAAKFPVVQCCEYKQGASVSHVSIDNYGAAYSATKHLAALGHKKIGMISCKNNFLSTINREEGYRAAIKDAGLIFNADYVAHGDYGYKSGLAAGEQLLSMPERPTAIFAISDIMAIGVIKAAKLKGLKVPDDLAVVGFDDISLSYMFDPMLTTVSQPKYELGCNAMELLLKQIGGEITEHKDILLEYELKIRESSFSVK
jgi:DNA-binding LacI/PurR family transcriptional regulator